MRVFSYSFFLLLLQLVFVGSGSVRAQVFDERFDAWPVELKINGTLIVSESPPSSNDFFTSVLSGGKKSVLVLSHLEDIGQLEEVLHLKASGISTVFQTLAQASDEPLEEDVIIWYDTRKAHELSDKFIEWMGNRLRVATRAGKIVCVIGPQAIVLSKQFIVVATEGNPSFVTGMNLLPDCVLECGYQKDNWHQRR